MRPVIAGLIALLVLLGANDAYAERRVALVIGVSKYVQVPMLANPARDADAMSSLLRSVGFDEVINKRDLGISDLRRAIREFADMTQSADIAVVYYAGHGIELDGANYLVPADAKLQSDFDIEDEAMSLDRLMKALDPARRLKLVILDACRDNPFARTMKRSVATRAIGRGLAKVEPMASDTLIAFAAKAGAVAFDGDGNNSPFAAALVRHIAEPGLDLRIALGRVRDDVMIATGHRQEPFVYGSLGGSNLSLVPPLPKAAEPDAAARIDFELAAQIGTRLAWEAFLGKHPSGTYAELARVQQRRLAEAEEGRAKAEAARRDAERLAALKSEELRRQLEDQSAKQSEEARRKISEQAKKELEEARRQLAAQAQRELDEARSKMEAAQKEAELARQQVEASKREAAVAAQRRAREDADRQSEAAAGEASRVAALAPSALPPPPAAPAMDAADLARLLQAHLKRVGCDPGMIDGNWTDKSRKALGAFNERTKGRLEVRVASLDALDAVRAAPDRVCPLECPPHQRADGERCAPIACDRGFALNSSGICVKRSEPAPRKQQASARREIAPRAERPARSSGGGGSKCFAFGGKTYCE